jgi:paraquat-inducible protein B
VSVDGVPAGTTSVKAWSVEIGVGAVRTAKMS